MLPWSLPASAASRPQVCVEEGQDEDILAFIPPEADGVKLDRVAGQVDSGEPVFSDSIPVPTPPSPMVYHPQARSPPIHTVSPGSITSTPSHPTLGPSAQLTYQTTLSPFLSHFETPPFTRSHSDANSTHLNAISYRLRRINAQGRASNSKRGRASEVSIEKEAMQKFKYGEKERPQSAPAQMLEHKTRRSGHFRAPGSMAHSAGSSVSFPSSMKDEETWEESIQNSIDFSAIIEDSPFPEVRASVSNIDDPDMPALTLRMWIIGLPLCMIASAINVFSIFHQRAPGFGLTAHLILSYSIGKFMEFTLPITTYHIHLPPPFSPVTLSFNPGPWNIKEHALTYIMASASIIAPMSINIVVVYEKFYGLRELGYWFGLTLTLAMQLTGFGLAGICRRYLVWPASIIWPQNLMVCALLNALNAEEEDITGEITRFKYFMIVLGASFFYYFLPGFLFQALGVFSFICWMVPNNVPINQVFGVSSGLGMSFVTFDWLQISWIGSPLVIPWWAQVNVFTGFVLFYWVLTPVLYYTNVWEFGHFPLLSNIPYDRFGSRYNVTRVLGADNTFNLTAYEEYSELFLPINFVVVYLLSFAAMTSVIVHTVLYRGKAFLNGFRRTAIEEDDIHAKLIRNYPSVPDWWFLLTAIFSFCCAVIACEVWGTNVPVWLLLLSLLLATIYTLPAGFIWATTGTIVPINVLAQIIPGSLLPGSPLANMIFKVYSLWTLSQAIGCAQNLKLGHYTKVPPRATFLVQVVSVILTAFVQLGVKEFMYAKIPDICALNQVNSFTCPRDQVFFTASVIWGLVGPSRQFGVGSLYHPILFATLIGAFLPIPFWLWKRRYPNSWVKSVSIPVILSGPGYIPPATGINYSSWFAVGFIFQHWIRKKDFVWWSKFNYITGAAIDIGTAFSLLFIFFTLQLPKNGALTPNWWGNTVFHETADGKSTAFLAIPPGGIPPR